VAANGVAMAPTEPFKFHRLFGDSNGNGGVNALDYNAFRGAFGKTTGQAGFGAAFDFDNSGSVNALDYNQFRSRSGRRSRTDGGDSRTGFLSDLGRYDAVNWRAAGGQRR
jgi:hypothetical protein